MNHSTNYMFSQLYPFHSRPAEKNVRHVGPLPSCEIKTNLVLTYIVSPSCINIYSGKKYVHTNGNFPHIMKTNASETELMNIYMILTSPSKTIPIENLSIIHSKKFYYNALYPTLLN